MAKNMKSIKKQVMSLVISLLLFSLLMFPVSAATGPVSTISTESVTSELQKSSTEIIEHAKDLNEKTIIYQGEIIGDMMQREDHIWINVSDGINAIGVWLTVAQASGLSMAGRYDTRGDIVRVTGLFSHACPEHGGDYDIHAQSIIKVQTGYPVEHPVNPWVVLLSLCLLIAAIIVLLVFRRQNNPLKEKWLTRLLTPIDSRLRLR
jgi:hypothetical protein